MNPKLSIIIPCYKQAQYLEEALQSVLEQTYMDWECIIVNDGSPDHTDEIAQKWVTKDTRFKYVFQENEGLSSARNAGIAVAVGEFILPLDADDKISKTYTNLAIIEFQKDNTLKVVYCKAEKFGEESGVWNLPTFSLHNLSRDNLIFCSALFRKRDWELAGGYDVKMFCGWEDWEFWIAILKNNGNVKCLDDICFYYRVKNTSMVTLVKEEQGAYLFDYLSVKHADFFVKQYGSYRKMNQELDKKTQEHQHKLNSEKFVIDLFLSTFFGFSIFGKYKKNKY